MTDMNGYRCDCGWLGREPNYHRELDKIDGGAARYVVVESCPDCEVRESLHEVSLCIDCAENGVDTIATIEGEFCKPCAAYNYDPNQLDALGVDVDTTQEGQFRRDRA